jgi:hypothetical protein
VYAAGDAGLAQARLAPEADDTLLQTTLPPYSITVLDLHLASSQ